ncbi:hypothetical protein CRYUN_Cryun10bG0121500 [Craigia yunnanensis]
MKTPIICGREPTSSDKEKKQAAERSSELSSKVNQFILRRTNALLSNHLPPKIVEVVCCKLTPLQSQSDNHFIHSRNVKRAITEETKHTKILAYITALKKLCNHPNLIYDTIRSGSPGATGFEDCMRFFPPEMFSGRSGSWTGGDGAWVELSGKMHTLDLFAQLCRERRYPYLRLDGTTSISKRQKLINRFNDSTKDEFVFLLSSKAGGCGLNLIGGNRLVLFDPDWNPANDKQAAARVWRDGQKKRVYIYRFLSTGTIEEKVLMCTSVKCERKGCKKLSSRSKWTALWDRFLFGNVFPTEDLRDLFTFYDNVRSEIHEKMNCNHCENYDTGFENIGEQKECESENGSFGSDQEVFDIGGFAGIAGCLDKLKSSEKQVGTPLEEDLVSWGHHFRSESVPDAILQASAGGEVTFVFTNQVDGKLVPIESKVNPRMQEREEGSKSQNIGKVNMIEREGNKMQNLDCKSNFLFKHHKLLNFVSSSSRNSLRITPSSSSTSSIPFQGQVVKSMTIT